MLAKHERNLPLLLDEMARHDSFDELRAIAVTARGSVKSAVVARMGAFGHQPRCFKKTLARIIGPGLSPCLHTGLRLARSLAARLAIPIIRMPCQTRRKASVSGLGDYWTGNG